MPKHDVWERRDDDFNITLTAGPTTVVNSVVQSLASNAGNGLEIRHIRYSYALATVNSTPPTVVNDFNSGIIGFYKWPEGISLPTVSEMNYQQDRRIFGAVPFTTQGTQPYRYSLRWPRIQLRPGEELITFCFLIRQSSAAADLIGVAQGQWVRTER